MSYYIRGERDRVKVARIHPNPWNPNQLTERTFDALKTAIRKHGFMQEILVRPHPHLPDEYQTIDGEHRSRAVEALSEDDPSSLVDVRVVDAKDTEAKKITLMMNRDRGEHDKVDEAHLLAELLDELGDELGEGLPWDQAELDELIALADVDWENYSEGATYNTDAHEGDGWVSVEVRMAPEDHQAFMEAHNKVAQDSGPLSDNQAVAYGQTVSALAMEYLGSYPEGINA